MSVRALSTGGGIVVAALALVYLLSRDGPRPETEQLLSPPGTGSTEIFPDPFAPRRGEPAAVEDALDGGHVPSHRQVLDPGAPLAEQPHIERYQVELGTEMVTLDEQEIALLPEADRAALLERVEEAYRSREETSRERRLRSGEYIHRISKPSADLQELVGEVHCAHSTVTLHADPWEVHVAVILYPRFEYPELNSLFDLRQALRCRAGATSSGPAPGGNGAGHGVDRGW